MHRTIQVNIYAGNEGWYVAEAVHLPVVTQGHTYTEPEKLRSILAVLSALDEIRWSEEANYSLINYCCDDLSASEKLLTHWLFCYIIDRQMLFERIWDVGGYVISHLVQSYSRTHPEEA